MSIFLKIEYKLKVCEEFKNLWASFFNCFEDDIRRRSITQNDEIAFEQIYTLISLNYWKFAEIMDGDFESPDRIVKLLNETVSLRSLKEVSDAQFSKIELEWHTIFIDINKTFGKLMVKRPRTKLEIKEAKRIKTGELKAKKEELKALAQKEKAQKAAMK